jgi:hypothetical protein
VAQSLDHFWVVRNTSILVGGQHPDGNEVGAVDIGQRNPLRIAEQAPVQLDPRRPTPVLAIGLPLVPLADCQVAQVTPPNSGPASSTLPLAFIVSLSLSSGPAKQSPILLTMSAWYSSSRSIRTA